MASPPPTAHRPPSTVRATPAAAIDVSVLIVTYNSEAQIVDCLRSVLAERENIAQEVIVLDNSPTDGTARIVREQFPEVRLIVTGKNLGFAAGVNAAAREARGEYLLLLNPDTVVLRHAVDRIVEFARAHPRNGFYGGRALKADGTLEPGSCWGLPTLWSMGMFACGLSAVGKRSALLNPESLGNWQRDTVREVDMISGCFLLVERAIWNRLGGFDERFFMYGEDADLAMRARAAGYRPLLCPQAEFVHEAGQSSATPAHKMLLLYRGKAALIHAHRRGIGKRIALLLLVSGVALRAFCSRLFKPGATGNDRWSTTWQHRHQWKQGYPP